MMSRDKYKILDEDSGWPYFLTETTVNWLPLFSNPEIASIVFDSLRFLVKEKRLILYAYVLMENHLHLIASAENLAKELANFKSFTARKSIDVYKRDRNGFILEQLAEEKLVHRRDRPYQFWQEGHHPKRIMDEKMMQQKIDYVHHNPVKHGRAENAEQYRWCSMAWFLKKTGEGFRKTVLSFKTDRINVRDDFDLK